MIAEQLTHSDLRKLFLVFSLYITSLIAANTLGLKLMPFLFGGHLSVAVFSFPVVFLATDVVGEVYGKKIARLFVFGGFLATALFILYSLISILLPWSSDNWATKEGYDLIFGVTMRMSFASLLAFIIAEYQDVVSFFFFKRKFNGKYFWLRSNLSNLWSQFLDTVIFTLVAFLGVYSTHTLISVIITWWIYKVLMGVLYTPLSYLGIYLLKPKTESGEKLA
ncbi:MAG: queuosine precursor transporter [Candidatus Taylorbacteria bacterium]